MDGFIVESAPTLITVLSAIFLAYLGWRKTSEHAEKKRRMIEQINFLNAQIERLYGPLYAEFIANDNAWKAYIYLYEEPEADANEGNEDLQRWCAWVKAVFMPINRRMAEAIVSNAHLIEDDPFPPAFEELLAHAKQWEGIVAQWDVRLFDKHRPEISYPMRSLEETIVPVYRRLRERRLTLINKNCGPMPVSNHQHGLPENSQRIMNDETSPLCSTSDNQGCSMC